MFKSVFSGLFLSAALMVPPANAQGSFESSGLGELESSGLGMLDPWGVGPLSRADGAMSLSQWQDSDIEVLTGLFNGLRTDTLTPVTRDLLRRVLLSSSRRPAGEGADELLVQRMFLIRELGELGAYISIMEQLPETDGLMSAHSARIDLQLLRGNLASACSTVRQTGGSEPYIFRARAGCFALEGNFSAADLALELGTDFGAADPWLSEAINAVRVLPEKPTERQLAQLPAANFASGLNTAISLEFGLPISEDAASAINPGFAAELISRSDIPRNLRIPLADRAAAAGLLSPEHVRRAYRLDPLPLRPTTNPDSDEPLNEDQDADAVTINTPVNALDEVLQIASIPSTEELDIVRGIQAALRASAETPEHFASAAAVLLPLMDGLRSLKAIGDNSELFALAAFAAGDQRMSDRFQRLVEIEGGPQGDPFMQAWLDGLRIVSGADPAPASARLVSARLADAARGPERVSAARMMAVFMALDLPLSPEARGFLSDNTGNLLNVGRDVDPREKALLRAALISDSTGEAFLRVIATTTPRPERVQADALINLLILLIDQGFESEARALALEALNFQNPGN